MTCISPKTTFNVGNRYERKNDVPEPRPKNTPKPAAVVPDVIPILVITYLIYTFCYY